MDTYFLLRSLKKSVWEIIDKERDVNIDSIEGYEELEASMDLDTNSIVPVLVKSRQFSKTCVIS